MTGTETAVHYVVDTWTVGRLRAALADVPDDVLLEVWVAEAPGGGFVDEQVVVGAGLVRPPRADEGEQFDSTLRIECEFPSGDYVRGAR